MKLHHAPVTDSPTDALKSQPWAETREIADRIVVGLDIDAAARRRDLAPWAA